MIFLRAHSVEEGLSNHVEVEEDSSEEESLS
jgi:hypothetical protein